MSCVGGTGSVERTKRNVKEQKRVLGMSRVSVGMCESVGGGRRMLGAPGVVEGDEGLRKGTCGKRYEGKC